MFSSIDGASGLEEGQKKFSKYSNTKMYNTFNTEVR